MISATTAFCLRNDGLNRVRETVSTTRHLDVSLVIIFAVLASLGLYDVMPYAAGVTFSVLTFVQALAMFAVRSAILDRPY